MWCDNKTKYPASHLLSPTSIRHNTSWFMVVDIILRYFYIVSVSFQNTLFQPTWINKYCVWCIVHHTLGGKMPISVPWMPVIAAHFQTLATLCNSKSCYCTSRSPFSGRCGVLCPAGLGLRSSCGSHLDGMCDGQRGWGMRVRSRSTLQIPWPAAGI